MQYQNYDIHPDTVQMEKREGSVRETKLNITENAS